MAAIVGYCMGESWTQPEIAALSVASDAFVLTDAEFFEEAADLLVAAETTADARTEFELCYRERANHRRAVLSGPSPSTDRIIRPDFGGEPIRA